MTKIAHFVGLDVHKDSITIAEAPAGRGPAAHRGTIPGSDLKLLRKLDQLGPRDTISCCYEAGPTGYGTYHCLRQAGIQCFVVAPTLIPAKAGDRVKTDSRDALKLARFHRSGDLTPVWVPTPNIEALRDLVRARAAAKADERAARHRLSKFLLRHGRYYPGKTPWTGAHKEWICKQKFDHEAQRRVLCDYVDAVDQIGKRLLRFQEDIAELTAESSLAPLVRALQALKGVQLLTASTIAVELGDLHRFQTARDLMSYVGLVASEHSSGARTRRFGITKTGNHHVRRILIEAAWAYRHPPRRDRALMKRSEGLSDKLTDIGWTAQQRLHRRYRRLLSKGKRKQVVVTAIARELAGFVWAIGQEVDLVPD